MIGNFLAILNFDRLLFKLDRFIVTNCLFSPLIGLLKNPFGQGGVYILPCVGWAIGFVST